MFFFKLYIWPFKSTLKKKTVSELNLPYAQCQVTCEQTHCMGDTSVQNKNSVFKYGNSGGGDTSVHALIILIR